MHIKCYKVSLSSEEEKKEVVTVTKNKGIERINIGSLIDMLIYANMRKKNIKKNYGVINILLPVKWSVFLSISLITSFIHSFSHRYINLTLLTVKRGPSRLDNKISTTKEMEIIKKLSLFPHFHLFHISSYSLLLWSKKINNNVDLIGIILMLQIEHFLAGII